METKNVRFVLMVSANMAKHLRSKENYSEYIRTLIDNDIKKQKRGKNKRLDI